MLLDSVKTDHQTHYKALGLPSNCTIYEIKKAYRTRILEIPSNKYSHRQKNEELSVRFLEAYESLSDPDQRFFYDLKIKQVPYSEKNKDLFIRNWRNLKSLMEQFNLAVIAILNGRHTDIQRRNELIIGVEDLRELIRSQFYQFIKENILPTDNLQTNEYWSYENYSTYQNLKILSAKIKILIDKIIEYKDSIIKEEEIIQFRNDIKILFEDNRNITHKLAIFSGIALGFVHGSDIKSLANTTESISRLSTNPSLLSLSHSNTFNPVLKTKHEKNLAYAMDNIIDKMHSVTISHAMLLWLYSMWDYLPL